MGAETRDGDRLGGSERQAALPRMGDHRLASGSPLVSENGRETVAGSEADALPRIQPAQTAMNNSLARIDEYFNSAAGSEAVARDRLFRETFLRPVPPLDNSQSCQEYVLKRIDERIAERKS